MVFWKENIRTFFKGFTVTSFATKWQLCASYILYSILYYVRYTDSTENSITTLWIPRKLSQRIIRFLFFVSCRDFRPEREVCTDTRTVRQDTRAPEHNSQLRFLISFRLSRTHGFPGPETTTLSTVIIYASRTVFRMRHCDANRASLFPPSDEQSVRFSTN